MSTDDDGKNPNILASQSILWHPNLDLHLYLYLDLNWYYQSMLCVLHFDSLLDFRYHWIYSWIFTLQLYTDKSIRALGFIYGFTWSTLKTLDPSDMMRVMYRQKDKKLCLDKKTKKQKRDIVMSGQFCTRAMFSSCYCFSIWSASIEVQENWPWNNFQSVRLLPDRHICMFDLCTDLRDYQSDGDFPNLIFACFLPTKTWRKLSGN